MFPRRGITYGIGVGETENGAEALIQDGIALALQRRYRQAFSTLNASPPSQAAYFLAGQLASIIGNYHAAYDDYVRELLAYLDLPAEPGPVHYGTIFDRPAMLRLITLSGR